MVEWESGRTWALPRTCTETLEYWRPSRARWQGGRHQVVGGGVGADDDVLADGGGRAHGRTMAGRSGRGIGVPSAPCQRAGSGSSHKGWRVRMAWGALAASWMGARCDRTELPWTEL